MLRHVFPLHQFLLYVLPSAQVELLLFFFHVEKRLLYIFLLLLWTCSQQNCKLLRAGILSTASLLLYSV